MNENKKKKKVKIIMKMETFPAEKFCICPLNNYEY